MNKFLSKESKTINPRKYLKLDQLDNEMKTDFERFFLDMISYLQTVEGDKLYEICLSHDAGMNRIMLGRIIPDNKFAELGKNHRLGDKQADCIVNAWRDGENRLVNIVCSECLKYRPSYTRKKNPIFDYMVVVDRLQKFVQSNSSPNTIGRDELIFYMTDVSERYATIITSKQSYLETLWEWFISHCNIDMTENPYLYELLHNRNVEDIFTGLFNKMS